MPGKIYQLRFRSLDGRLSRSLTLTTAYSCLSLKELIAPKTFQGKAQLVFESSQKCRLVARARLKDGEIELSIDSTDGKKHVLSYSFSKGQFASLELNTEEGQVYLPTIDLYKETIAVLSNLDVDKTLATLQRNMKKVVTSVHDSNDRRVMEETTLMECPHVPRFLALSPFIPLVLEDDVIKERDKMELCKMIFALSCLDACGEYARAEPAIRVDELLAPMFRLSKGKGDEPREKVVIRDYYPTPLILAPTSLLKSKEKAATLASMKIIHPEVDRPTIRETVTFEVDAKTLRSRRRVELVIGAHIYFPCYLVNARLNDKFTIPLRHPWGRFCAERLGETKKEVIAIVHRRREIPKELLNEGKNKIVLTATSPFEEYGGQLPVLREVHLNFND